MNAVKCTIHDARSRVGDGEGLVLLGCGGELQEWIDGVSKMLYEQGIAAAPEADAQWKEVLHLTTTGGRHDLVLVFKSPAAHEIDKLVMWRLKFGDASWWTDYNVNYAHQH